MMNETMLERGRLEAKHIGFTQSPSHLDTAFAGILLHIKMMVSDVLAFFVAIFSVSSIHWISFHVLNQQNDFTSILMQEMSGRYLLFLPVLIYAFMYGGLYRRSAWESREIERVVKGCVLLGLADAAILTIGDAGQASAWMLVIWPLSAANIVVFRMILRTVPFGLRLEAQHVLLVGDGIDSDEFLHELRESRCGPVRILCKLPIGDLAPLGKDEVDELLSIVSADSRIPQARIRIVLAPSAEEIDQAQALVVTLAELRRPYSLMLPFRDLAQRGLSLHEAVGADFVFADVDCRALGQFEQVAKRAFDLLISVAAILLLAPLLLIIAMLLKLEGGPVFYTQLRISQHGRRFRCYKFRSMRPGADQLLLDILARDPTAREEWQRHQKLASDPRVTRLGEFLRTTSLDELPQLFNVVLGDMSIVGPRPIVAPEVAGYDSDRAYYESSDFSEYASCKPGITGLWQVSGRTATTHRERVRLDRWYCRNASLWVDLMIILKTVRAVICRTGK